MQEKRFLPKPVPETTDPGLVPGATGTAQSETGLTLRDLIRIAVKRWRVIAYFTAGVALVTFIALVFSKPQYEVTAQILVKKDRAAVALTPGDSSQLIISQVQEQDLNTEIQILISREVIEKALAAMEPAKTESTTHWWQVVKTMPSQLLNRFRDKEELPLVDQMVLAVGRQLEVQPIDRSNMIGLKYTSDDPEWATEFVTALTESYIERRGSIFQSSKALPFFDEQMSTAGRQLAEAEGALQTELAAVGLTLVRGAPDPLASQKEMVLRNQGRLNEELLLAKVSLAALRGKVATLQSRLEEESERLPSADSKNQDQAIEELERVLVQLKLERDDLAQSFSPGSRRVQDIEAQIILAEEYLENAETRVGGINRTEINPVYSEGRSRLLSAEADLQGARDRFRSLALQVEGSRAVVAELNRQSLTLDHLSREADLAEEAYLLYRKKREEARISAAMDEQRLVNVVVAQPARSPLAPTGPGRMVRFFLALLLALAGGLTLAVLIDQFGLSYVIDDEPEERRGIGPWAPVSENNRLQP